MFKEAAHCFVMSGKWAEAAAAYEQANDVINTLKCCYKLPDYESALGYLDVFQDRGLLEDESLRKECTRKAALYYHGAKDPSKMMTYVHKFPAVVEKRLFLHRYNYHDYLLEIELKEGRFLEVARIYEGFQDWRAASEYYEKAECPMDSVRCALKAIRCQCLDENFLSSFLSEEQILLLQKSQVGIKAFSKASSAGTAGTRTVALSAAAMELEIALLLATASSTVDNRAAIMSIAQPAAGTGGGTASDEWMVQFNATRRLVQLLNEASVRTSGTEEGVAGKREGVSSGSKRHATAVKEVKGVSSSTASVSNHWRELVPFCLGTHASVLTVINSLRLLSPCSGSKAVHVPSADQRRVRQCLDFFGLTLENTEKNSMVSLEGQFVRGLKSVKGYTKLFGVRTTPVSTSLVSLGAASAPATYVRYQVKEVAQRAVLFFESETKRIITDLANFAEKELAELPRDTFSARAERQLIDPRMRPVVDPHSAKRVELLLELHTLYSQPLMEVSSSKSRTVRSQIVDIILPRIPSIESHVDIAAMRVNSSIVRDILKHILKQRLLELRSSKKLNYGTIFSSILLAEITGDLHDVSIEFNKRLKTKQLNSNHAYYLVNSFLHECMETAPPSELHGSLLYSVITGTNTIISSNPLRSIILNSHTNDSLGCMPPSVFLPLVEKYFVLLLLHMKKAKNIILPTCLASDVLCRRNPAYCTALCSLLEQDGVNPNARTPLYELNNYLLWALERLTCTGFRAWLKSSNDERIGDDTDERNSCLTRLIMLLLLYAVNCLDTDNIRTRYCVQIRLIMSRESDAALRKVPYALQKLFKDLDSKSLLVKLSQYCQTSGDPLVSINSRSNAMRSQKLEQKIFAISDEGDLLTIVSPETATMTTELEDLHPFVNEDANSTVNEDADDVLFPVSGESAVEPVTGKTEAEKLQPYEKLLLAALAAGTLLAQC